VAAYADGGYATVVDGIISPKWFFAPLCDALASRGHAVSYAILRPPLATCIARAAARADDALGNRRRDRPRHNAVKTMS